MPLRVHCPSGCLIHMSTNRAGRIVRCPQCKSAIRIPIIPASELASGKPIPCHAREAIRRSSSEQDPAQESPDVSIGDLASSPLDVEHSSISEQGNLGEQANSETVESEVAATHPVGPAEPETTEIQRHPRLEVPDLVKPLINRRRQMPALEPEADFESEVLVNVHPVPEFENDDSRELTDQEIAAPVETVINPEVAKAQGLDDGNIANQPATTPADVEQEQDPAVPIRFDQQVTEPEVFKPEIVHPTADSSVAEEAGVSDLTKKKSAAFEPPLGEPDIGEPNGPISEPQFAVRESAEPKAAESESVEPPTLEPETVESETVEPEFVEPESVEPRTFEPAMFEPETVVSAPFEPETVEPETVEAEAAVIETADSIEVDHEIEDEISATPDLIESFSKRAADFIPDQIDFLPRPNRAKLPETVPIISLNEPTQPAFVAHEERSWEERLKRANADRRMLARFFAICLCIVAVVNMVPALYHWYHWTQLAESMALPRWIYIQVFVGAIHLVYAVFLFQINDWSAMRAVSVAMLAVAFVFGFISTGLLVGGGQGELTGFLGIPYTLNRQASIWCVAMLCLATLMSYWGGKESTNWQRAENLLKDILSKSAV